MSILDEIIGDDTAVKEPIEIPNTFLEVSTAPDTVLSDPPEQEIVKDTVSKLHAVPVNVIFTDIKNRILYSSENIIPVDGSWTRIDRLVMVKHWNGRAWGGLHPDSKIAFKAFPSNQELSLHSIGKNPVISGKQREIKYLTIEGWVIERKDRLEQEIQNVNEASKKESLRRS